MGEYSPPSPKGRSIEHIEGSPSDIIARGREIERLGQQMLDAADTLQRLKDNTFSGGGQQGKAIEALQDKIGDSYSTLKQAGELYHPVGPIITQYGESLETYKPLIDNTADDCGDLWAAYEALPGDKEGSTTPEAGGGFMGIGGHDADSPEAKKDAAENQAKKQAYDEWENAAERFDTWYDVWEDAFDEASAGVEDKMAGSIKDSFWDDFGDIISVLTEVLSWAALIVGIVAFFCGGWVVALGAALAIAAFALTAVKYANGKASGWDLAFAAIAIVPVGKITSLTKLAQFPKLASASTKMNALSRTWKAVGKGPIDDLVKNYNKPLKLLSKSEVGEKLLGKSVKSIRSANIGMYVGNRSLLEANLSTVRTLSKIDSFASRAGTFAGHYGKVSTAIGNTTGVKMPPIPAPVGVFI